MPDDDKAPDPQPPQPEQPAVPDPEPQERPEPIKNPILIGESEDPDDRGINLEKR